ncbi:MAG: T9SS type A sorting domain-containing protein, partial [Candidatus Marinimicrobia bacterium]|nr:T9SS type A sorting domain-containing protein [Candidatus Neomarinimicrobiota bacterium]
HLVKFDGNTWSVIYTGEGVTTLAIHNNTLYFGTDGTGKVYHLNATTPVFDYNLANGERCVGDLVSFNGQLYAVAGYELDTNDPRAGYLYANNTSSVKLQCSPLQSSEFNLGETGGGIRVDWNAPAPAGTGVSLWGQSRTAEEAWDNTARWYDIPKGEPVAMEDSLIRYQAFLWSIFDGATPVLEEVSIETHVTVAGSLEISDIRIMPLDATSVQISWRTNIPARGLAFLGTEQGNYPIEGMEYPGFFTEHSVVIGDLTTGTMYYGVIHQSDETYDQYVISEEFSFVMEPYTGTVQIQNIWDVADDQGGWVYVNWLADGWDFTGEITQYGVWEFNANEGWVSVGSVPATQSEHYTYLAHTFGDSSMDGIFWSRFVITAHTMTPDEFFVSPVDSGYSVDNIHPGIPTNLLAEFETTDGVRLTWDAPLDEDFSHYEIFRDLTPDFVPTESLAELVDITYLDPVADLTQTYYYRIIAVDLHGNRSEATPAVAATFTGINTRGIPDHYALEAAFPNPFNPATNIRFALPETGLARLVIYDARGQVVKTLLDREFSAGVHQIRWNGRNDAGVLVSTGIYFYRLEVNGFSQTRKMILMK